MTQPVTRARSRSRISHDGTKQPDPFQIEHTLIPEMLSETDKLSGSTRNLKYHHHIYFTDLYSGYTVSIFPIYVGKRMDLSHS